MIDNVRLRHADLKNCFAGPAGGSAGSPAGSQRAMDYDLTMTSTLATTPLDSWHRDHDAVMVPFAGYEMPIRYGSIVAEHLRTRQTASLFDVSHMGRLRFEGEGADQFLDHLLTRQISDMPIGHVRYALMCNAEGGVLDDVLVSNVETPSGKQYYLMVVNASNRHKILQWLTPILSKFPTVTVSDRTELTAMIAIQGPRAVSVCSRLFNYDPARLANYRCVVTEQMGKPVILSRTGYTGEDGLELIVRAEDAIRVWKNVLLAGREEPFEAAGLGARDTLRLEAAMPLYGHELTEKMDPLTAGLKFACDLDHSFIGDHALREIALHPTPQLRIGLLIDGKRPAREGCVVSDVDGKRVGVITSGGPAPSLGEPIAMAYVDRAAAKTEIFHVDIRGKTAVAKRVKLPFYRRPKVVADSPSSSQPKTNPETP